MSNGIVSSSYAATSTSYGSRPQDSYFLLAAPGLINGNLEVTGNLKVDGTTELVGAVKCDAALEVDGNIAALGDVAVDGALNLAGALNAPGACNLGAVTAGGVSVAGLASTGNVNLTGTASLGIAGNLTVAGPAVIQGAYVQCAGQLTAAQGVTTNYMYKGQSVEVGPGPGVPTNALLFDFAAATPAAGGAAVVAEAGLYLVNVLTSFGPTPVLPPAAPTCPAASIMGIFYWTGSVLYKTGGESWATPQQNINSSNVVSWALTVGGTPSQLFTNQDASSGNATSSFAAVTRLF